MSSTSADTWNNPQIPPPPPSPAVVGTRFRDVSPSAAAADYEARFPELPAAVDDSTKATPSTSNTTASTTTTTESSLPHPTDSAPRAPKKRRTRSTGVEDATPRPRPPVPVLPTTQYVGLQPPYYPTAPPLESHQLDYHSAQAYCTTPTYGGYSPPTQVLRPLPYPTHMRDAYCGNTYAPPVHYPHPLPTPPPPPAASVATYMAPGECEGGDCQRCETTTATAGKGRGGKAKGAAEAETGYIPPQDGDKKYVPSAYYSTTTPPPSPTAVRVPTGYPFLAESLAGAPGLQVYRRFAKLNHLVLLHLQDEIAELEGVLEGLDAWEYGCAGGVGLRARRGMGTGSRRLQVMGAIAFKLQQYNKALKGYREMMDALDPLGEGDLEAYRAWMAEQRPLVDVEGRVVGDHPEDLARLYRRPKIRNSEITFSPTLKMGLTVLSCGIVGVAGSLRVSRAADVPLALAAGAMGGAAAAMWAFF